MWSIAQAKQQFSELVRLSEAAPQPIMRHHKEVAVLLSARDFEEFQQLRRDKQPTKTIGQQFLDGMSDIRQMLQDADPDYQGIELPSRADRANAVADMLEHDYPFGETDDGLPKGRSNRAAIKLSSKSS
jgi:prevent-host-death family protein